MHQIYYDSPKKGGRWPPPFVRGYFTYKELRGELFGSLFSVGLSGPAVDGGWYRGYNSYKGRQDPLPPARVVIKDFRKCE